MPVLIVKPVVLILLHELQHQRVGINLIRLTLSFLIPSGGAMAFSKKISHMCLQVRCSLEDKGQVQPRL